MAARGAALAAALFAASAAPALSEGNYSVRNGTSRAFTCGLRHERRSVIDRFVLRSGDEWSQETVRDGPRVLLCDSWKITDRWQMRSGVAYRLEEDRRTGRVVLREQGSPR